LLAQSAAGDTALRKDEVEHRPHPLSVGGSSLRLCAESVGLSLRQTEPAAQQIVGLEQLLRIADVAPFALEAIAVDRRARVEPGDESPGLVRRVALLEIPLNER